jgi:hypothetical protein
MLPAASQAEPAAGLAELTGGRDERAAGGASNGHVAGPTRR